MPQPRQLPCAMCTRAWARTTTPQPLMRSVVDADIPDLCWADAAHRIEHELHAATQATGWGRKLCAT